MKTIKSNLIYIRWHLIAIRYLSLFKNYRGNFLVPSAKSKIASSLEINLKGFSNGPKIDDNILNEIRKIYESRIKDVVIGSKGAPFVNLIKDEDITIDNPIMKIAFSKDVFDAALDYFGGKIILDSIQLLYSVPTAGELRESQKWHKDFGDTKSFHSITYLNDVTSVEEGPFVFLNKENSKKMKWSLFIRRISDNIMQQELKNGEVEYFYGKAGSTVFVDPAMCYHYGSRCKIPRYAIFVTFNSTTPFVSPLKIVENNQGKLLEVASNLRPDLSKKMLKNIIGV
ncbi:hypothetical protein [Flavobacterium urumqiense]|uniref:Phytanoyl-CoA dioxygenase (PhyH) n=1 Tax=Flavobacterium urumqiense TaxID=935224 RepID=A0A1H5Y293_9FLAO|nr:hypothetical protein [Flavobacterium urumqiense]SEG18043.1 hypothetical protein SAMN04488130_10732 [Flavobacterium urumqiense]